jgi:hypothetical protein
MIENAIVFCVSFPQMGASLYALIGCVKMHHSAVRLALWAAHPMLIHQMGGDSSLPASIGDAPWIVLPIYGQRFGCPVRWTRRHAANPRQRTQACPAVMCADDRFAWPGVSAADLSAGRDSISAW